MLRRAYLLSLLVLQFALVTEVVPTLAEALRLRAAIAQAAGSDDAILRLAVPYTGMILSTRETANLRQETFALGISQISAGSRTNPGGYEENEEFDAAQFQLGDHRSLDEVIRDISELGFVPSFCTACYRLGRTDMCALPDPELRARLLE